MAAHFAAALHPRADRRKTRNLGWQFGARGQPSPEGRAGLPSPEAHRGWLYVRGNRKRGEFADSPRGHLPEACGLALPTLEPHATSKVADLINQKRLVL